MRLELVELAVIEAIAEIQEPVPVALVFLLSDSDQVVREYPDLPASTSPQDYNTGDVVNIVFEPEGEVFELEPSKQEVIDQIVSPTGVIRADVDVLAF